MGNIPLPALDVAPIQQGPDPIKRYQELVAIRAAQQQQQQQAALNPIQRQQAQAEAGSAQLNYENQQQLRNAFNPPPPQTPNVTPSQPSSVGGVGPIKPNPQPAAGAPGPATGSAPALSVSESGDEPDPLEALKNRLTTQGGPAALPVLKMYGELQKYSDEHATSVQNLKESAQKVAAGRADFLGLAFSTALASIKAGANPQDVLTAMEAKIGKVDPDALAEVKAEIQQRGAGALGDIAQEYISNSPKQAEFAKDLKVAETRTSPALQELQAKLPGGPLYAPTLSGQEANQRVSAETSPAAIAGQAKLAAAKANAEIPAAAAKALAVQKATQQLLQGPALDQAAQRYNETGQMPSGMRGPAIATQIMNRNAELNPGASLAANSAAYQANKASYENVTKTLDTLSAFENTGLKNLQNFSNLAEKIPDTGIPWLSTPIRSLNQNLLGNPDQAAAVAAGQVALREIARVTNDPKLSGALTDSARQEVSSLIPAGATLPQIKRVAQVLIQDMSNVHQGLAKQKQDIGQRLGIGGGQGQNQVAAPHVIQIGPKKYQYKGSGNTADLSNYTELK